MSDLRAEDVSVSFGEKEVLAGASLSLPAGKATCLVGGNGSGKTTLLNVLTGFLRPASGSVYLGARDITRYSPHRIARLGVARTFQELRLIRGLTVRENLLLASSRPESEKLTRTLSPWWSVVSSEGRAERRADELIAEYFLGDVRGSLASELSFGQQKLLTLACSMATGAQFVLLDEPVAGISDEHREQIADKISHLAEDGRAILLIEHQADFLKRVGDSFLVLVAGQVQQHPRWSEALAVLQGGL